MKLAGKWPQATNNPTLGIHLDYQAPPTVDTIEEVEVWDSQVTIVGRPPPPPWTPAIARSTP
eukprot:7405813-Karenia_brevis.AAC.1